MPGTRRRQSAPACPSPRATRKEAHADSGTPYRRHAPRRDEADWAVLEDKIRTVARAGWWIDQRDSEGSDLPELLDAAASDDIGTENPFQ